MDDIADFDPAATAVFARRLAFACASLLLSAFQTAALAQTATSPIPLPSPFTPIVDNANVIDAETEKKLGVDLSKPEGAGQY